MSKSKVKTLGDRMKEYEAVSDFRLTKRTPVIIRIDGKAFHTYTRGMDKPFDETLNTIMAYVCEELVQNIQGCKLAYSQSDEISLLLTDWNKINTESFFDYRIQKVVSVASSMATMYFNKFVTEMCYKLETEDVPYTSKEREDYLKLWKRKAGLAMFDARAYNLPENDVCNYFLWRQQDASRNSVQMLGRSKFSFKQMQNKSNSDVQDMLMLEYNINWNDIPTKWKRGFCVYKDVITNRITTNTEIPLFNQDRDFINKFLKTEEKEI